MTMISEITHSQECPNCGVYPGQYHVPGCDVERCSCCGGQLIACFMRDDTPPPDERLPWTGVWPGVAECREFGWYARAVPGGWEPCDEDEPMAMPDLNRLRSEPRWDRDNRRFVRSEAV